MSNLLPFIVTGIVTGIIYGLAGSGLVLTFKTSGIFNFGHGAVLTASVLVFYWLRVTLELDWKIAFFVSVFVAGPLLGIVMELVARQLSQQRTNMKIVGTVGLVVMVLTIFMLVRCCDSWRATSSITMPNSGPAMNTLARKAIFQSRSNVMCSQ